mgnify:CR=1 FL=1
MLIQVNNMIAQMRRDLLYRMFSHPEIIQDARTSHRAIFNSLKAKDRNACISAVASHISTTRSESRTSIECSFCPKSSDDTMSDDKMI